MALNRTADDPLLPRSDSFEDFLTDLESSLEHNSLPSRALDVIFGLFDFVHPACNGDWMEFGVGGGASLNKAADYRASHCPAECPPVFGFDTFTGSPEHWVVDGHTIFHKGSFSMDGKLPEVAPNALLIKGLFADSIPPLLSQQRAWVQQYSEGWSKWGPQSDAPLAYLHIDCELYSSARDVLTLMNHKIVPGTIILFDELINYALYKDNEMKALWEWLQETGAKLATVGTMGPVDNLPEGKIMDPVSETAHAQEFQSTAFVVMSKPGSTYNLWS
ncbi:hypothetical protein WJX73_001751 [Symbiochloris irregularis]|uniref:Uncharacterized protein n=1 Tax=Symbiochloris irregularis TaxID=706552 RepID=A0AAW1PN23_9CHLO